MSTKIKFSQGQRVQYKHGKGLSTGTIQSMEGDKATLGTVGGKTAIRMLKGLKAIKG